MLDGSGATQGIPNAAVEDPETCRITAHRNMTRWYPATAAVGASGKQMLTAVA